MKTPVRELRIASDMRLYVSDAGAIVIEQTFGDTQAVFFEPAMLDELIASLLALRESASARQSMVDALLSAEYAAWVERGEA